MKRFIWILKKILFLPPIPTTAVAVTGYTLIILTAALRISVPFIQYLAYLSSAYALAVTITGFPYFVHFVKSTKALVKKHPLAIKLQNTSVGKRFFSDVRFRTELSLYQGLLINLLYIAVKLFSGIYYHSLWFIALAFYYILLAAMRILLLHQRKKRNYEELMEHEFFRYRLCGIILLLMNQALVGIVIFIVHQNKGFDYPGLLIYAMALYVFYSVILAAVNLIKFRKHGSPVMSAAKVINLVAAMVSILSLQTAMLARFGEEDEAFRAVMTGVTGGVVCAIVSGMAIFMIWKSAKQLKKLQMKGDSCYEREKRNF